MAACAVNRQAGECRHGRHHHVVPIEKTGNALVYRVFPKLRVSDEIPGTRGNEARGDNTLRVIRKQDVAGQLFFQKACVRFVVVERTNHVVSVGPGIEARLVFVVAMRLTIVNRVQPVSSPTFSITWRRQQTVDQFFVGERRLVVHKIPHFFRSRRKTVQVVGQAPNQGTSIGLGRRRQAFLLELCQNECVDGCANPWVVRRCRGRARYRL